MSKGYGIVVASGLAILLAGCSAMTSQPTATRNLEINQDGSPIQREAPITDTGRQSAVLSLHQRTVLQNGCRYGLTLSNNMTVPIADLPLRFTAFNNNDVRLQSVTRSFFDVRPTAQQFAQIDFQFDCHIIERIAVSDPGRCVVGELTRRSGAPAACLNLIDIPQSPFVDVVRDDLN